MNIPFKGYIAAGQPIEVIEEYETIPVPRSLFLMATFLLWGLRGQYD